MSKISVGIETYLTTHDVNRVKPTPSVQNQWGPSCGFYALSGAMRAFKPSAPPARKRDEPSYFLKDPSKPEGPLNPVDPSKKSLRHLGKRTTVNKKAVTDLGPIYSADGLAAIARRVNFDARVFSVSKFTYEAKLRELIDTDCLAVVPFDVQSSGDPGTFGGEHAHYAVVFGYYYGTGTEVRCVANHWSDYFDWSVADLIESSGQLYKDSRGTYKKRLIDIYGTGAKGMWIYDHPDCAGLMKAARNMPSTYTKSTEETHTGADLTGLRNKIIGIAPGGSDRL